MATTASSPPVSALTSSSSEASTPTSVTPSSTSNPTTVSTPPPATSSTNAATSASQTRSTAILSSPSSAVTSTSTSSPISTSSPTASQIVTSSGDTALTVTSFITPTVSSTPQSSSNSGSSNSFFSNKGAVAGVFTVVGLIVVALAVALVINCVRRRRAQKFDRDVAEAAAEAAASSRSPFDDYPYNNTGGNDSGGYGYSDNSHGTYQLPPMPPQNEAYGMSEMSQYDPYAAGAASLTAAAVGRSRSRKDSEPGTSGIAGVGAGTLVRESSKRAPYHAFAGPGAQPHELQNSRGTRRSQRGTNQDILEAAGLVDAGAAAAGGGAPVTRKPSDTTQNTHVSVRSQIGSMSNSSHRQATPWQSGYPIDSYYPQRNDSHNTDPFAGYPPAVTSTSERPLPNPYEAAMSSPPPAPAPPPSHPLDSIDDHPELTSPIAVHSDEQRMSYQDNADYSQGNRILRVANE